MFCYDENSFLYNNEIKMNIDIVNNLAGINVIAVHDAVEKFLVTGVASDTVVTSIERIKRNICCVYSARFLCKPIKLLRGAKVK